MERLMDLYSLNPKSPEPKYDLCSCSSCGWNGRVSDCDTDTEGTWEEGYYLIHLCPNEKCDDGSIDDYFYSKEQLKKYRKWEKEND